MIKNLIKKSSKSLIIRVSGSLLTLAMTILITNKLGVADSGVYFLAFSIFSVFASVASLGLTNEALRQNAYCLSENNYRESRFLLINSIKTSFVSGVCFAVVLYILAGMVFTNIFQIQRLNIPLTLFAFAVPFFSVMTVVSMYLQGASKASSSVLCQFFLTPCLCCVLLLLLDIDLNSVVALYLFSLIVSTVFAVYLAERVTNQLGIKLLSKDSILQAKFVAGTWSLLFIQIFMVLNQHIGQFMLGIWSSESDVALFSVAKRLTMLLGFVIAAVNTIVAPKLAECHKRADHDGMVDVVKSATMLLITIATPVLVVVNLFPGFILQLFGHDFVSPESVLSFRILILGQYVNLITGTVAYLLIATKNESVHKNNIIYSFVVTAVLGTLLRDYGILGVSTAVTAGVILCNLLSWHSSLKRVNINTLKFW